MRRSSKRKRLAAPLSQGCSKSLMYREASKERWLSACGCVDGFHSVRMMLLASASHWHAFGKSSPRCRITRSMVPMLSFMHTKHRQVLRMML
nr:hypothetical protein [Prevotella sp.]